MNRHPFRHVVLGSVLLAASTVAASTVAISTVAASTVAASTGADGPGHALLRPGGVAVRLVTAPPGRTRPRRVKSANWSGYAVHGGRYHSVSASWTEPAGTCRSGNGVSSFWVGLDGYDNATVEQTGTVTGCHGGRAVHYAWYEMAPAGGVTIRHPVRADDKLSASVSYDGNGKFTLELTDSTQGWTAVEVRSRASARRSSAEVIAEGPSVLLPDFGTVRFSAARVDRTSLGRLHPTKIIMVYRGKQLDKVSALSCQARFSVTWLHG
jgi:hypothetical protein